MAASAQVSRTRRNRRRLIIAGVVGVVVLWLGVAAFMLLRARSDAQQGLDILQATERDLGPAELIRGEGLGDLRRAQASFERADSAASSPLLAPLKLVPLLGRQVRSVGALAGSASDVTRVGADAMQASTQELDRRPADGPARVVLLEHLGAIADDAREQLRQIDLGPDTALMAPLATARRKFDHELGRVRQAMIDVDDASVGIAQMAKGSRYLVLAANNSEMRAGSGMLLSAGMLDTHDGSFQLGDMTPTRELLLPEGGGVPVSGDFAETWGFLDPGREWRSLLASPEFSTSAELAAQMWTARTGEKVDGVLAIDPVALRSILAATGPVVVDGKEYTADNVVQEMLYQQYVEFDTPDPLAVDALTQERQERLSRVARAAIDRLDATGWDTAALVDQLKVAAEGRHVLAWSSIPEQQRAWRAAGISGDLSTNSLLLAVLNLGGNKLDQFLPVEATLTHRAVKQGTEVTVAMNLRNVTPEGLNAYIAGPYPGLGLAAGEYSGYLSANVPGIATDVTLEGTDRDVTQGPDGKTSVIAGSIKIPRGGARTVTLRFVLPPGVRTVRVEPSARIPPVGWTANGQTWTDQTVKIVRV